MVFDGASNGWGSADADTLTGNSGAKLLQGNGGNDTLDGGEGSDTAVYNLAYDQYTLSYANGVVTVSTAGSDGTDNLTGIELLTFQDGLLDISTWTGGVLPGFQADILVGTSGDRKSVVMGKSVSVRGDLGGRRIIKQKTSKIKNNG